MDYTKEKERILKSEKLLKKAMIAGDIAILDKLLSESLKFITPDHKKIGKQDDLNAHQSGLQKITEIKFLNQSVNVMNSSHIETVSEAEVQGMINGQDFSGKFLYKRTRMLLDGRYQITEGSCSQL